MGKQSLDSTLLTTPLDQLGGKLNVHHISNCFSSFGYYVVCNGDWGARGLCITSKLGSVKAADSFWFYPLGIVGGVSRWTKLPSGLS
jgi:hypothetical protein